MQRPPDPADGAAAVVQPSGQPAKQPRLMAVDALRGWAIVLVAAAHVVWGLRMADMHVPQAFLNMYDFIYTFSAQALFFVSGCLAVGSLRRGRLALTLGKARALMYPYVVWSLIIWTLRAVSPVQGNAPAELYQILYMFWEPYDIYWFLYELFLFFAAYALLAPLGVPVLVGVASVLFAIKGLVFMPKILFLFCTHFLYFCLGVACAPLVRLAPREPKPLPLLFLAAGLMTVQYVATAEAAWGLHLPLYQSILTFTAVAFGISGSTAMLLALGQGAMARGLAYLGAASIHIYVAHTLFTAGTRIMLRKVFGVDDFAVQFVLGFAAGVAGPILLYKALKAMRMEFFYKI